MASPDVVTMIINAVSEIKNGISDDERRKVAALMLYDLGEAKDTENFKGSLARWKLTVDEVSKIGETEERFRKETGGNVARGSQCQ